MGLLETDITNVFCLFGLLGHSFFCFLFDCPPWTILGIYSRVIHPPIKKTLFYEATNERASPTGNQFHPLASHWSISLEANRNWFTIQTNGQLKIIKQTTNGQMNE